VTDTPTEDYEDLYENAPCGFLSVRNDGSIFKVNGTFSKWIGFTPEQLVGKRFHEFLNIAGRIFYETHFAPLLRMQGFFNEVALDFVTSEGERMPTLVNATERRGPNGEQLFSRITVFKATDRRRYERELVDARAAADEARAQLQSLNENLEARIRKAVAEILHNESEAKRAQLLEAETQESLRKEREVAQLREQFIAVLGHDLRNPLAALLGGMTMLLRQPQNERSTTVLAMMQKSTARMATLIDNVMDFARSRLGGGIALDRSSDESVEITLKQVVDEFRFIAPERAFETNFAITEPVSFDKARIAQLVSNLLGNALTHGAAETPISVRATTEAGMLEISVANAGEPISEKAMERLFQPFFRGEVRHSQQGLGLGLHIASEIAMAHDGVLTVKSSTQETRFVFRMPLG
jgi:sigma-B regulation protein RsbU (phosphoserine phosphatase)